MYAVPAPVQIQVPVHQPATSSGRRTGNCPVQPAVHARAKYPRPLRHLFHSRIPEALRHIRVHVQYPALDGSGARFFHIFSAPLYDSRRLHEYVIMGSKPIDISFGKLDDDALVHDRTAAHCSIDSIRSNKKRPPDAEGTYDQCRLARLRALVFVSARRHLDFHLRRILQLVRQQCFPHCLRGMADNIDNMHRENAAYPSSFH